jgi:hypothetical protein
MQPLQGPSACGAGVEALSLKVKGLSMGGHPSCGGGGNDYVKGPATELAKITEALCLKTQKINDALEACRLPIPTGAPGMVAWACVANPCLVGRQIGRGAPSWGGRAC